jgi:hypothetical protein
MIFFTDFELLIFEGWIVLDITASFVKYEILHISYIVGTIFKMSLWAQIPATVSWQNLVRISMNRWKYQKNSWFVIIVYASSIKQFSKTLHPAHN